MLTYPQACPLTYPRCQRTVAPYRAAKVLCETTEGQRVEPMSQVAPLSEQWVTCPGCNKTSLRSTADLQHRKKSWFDTAWTPCSPECAPKTHKRQRWSLICSASIAVCFTLSAAFHVYAALVCPGAERQVMQWMYLAMLPVFWGLFVIRMGQYRRASQAFAVHGSTQESSSGVENPKDSKNKLASTALFASQ